MLSMCLIVKNEIEVIKRCLTSAKAVLGKVLNDVVVVDTGSTDGTKELVEKLGCSVYDFEWCNDFAAARNFSISKAMNDWVLVLDADEFVTKCELEEIVKFLVEENEYVIGEIDIVNYGDFEGVSYTTDMVPRLFNRKNVEYVGIVHETPALKNKNKPVLKKINIEIHHTGYIDQVADEKNKADRNIELLKIALENKEDMYLTMQLGKSYMRKGEFIKAIECFDKIVFKEELVKYEFYAKSVSEYIRCLINLNQSEAGLVFEKFWDRCLESDSYIYYMGHVYFRTKYYEKAVDCFLMLLNRDEKELSKVMVKYSLGQLFASLEMYEESLMYFKMCGDYEKAVYNIEQIEDIMNNK